MSERNRVISAFSILKFVAVLGALITLLMNASTHVLAEEEGL